MSGITGYRKLDENEILLINKVKNIATQVGELLDTMSIDPTLDQRWLAIGRTDLQKGFMFAIRAIAQPTTF